MAVNDEVLQDLDEYGQDEIDDLEDLIVTGATTAETVEQLGLEVDTLKALEEQALGVLRSGRDAKWAQLDRILDDPLMVDTDGNRRKLIVFTEPKDTLHYLHRQDPGAPGQSRCRSGHPWRCHPRRAPQGH